MSIKLMTLAWDMKIPCGTKLVLLAICDSCNDQGTCYPGIPTIAKKCSMSERSVFYHMDWLEKRNILYRENRKGRSSIYHIDPCKLCTPEDSAPLKDLHHEEFAAPPEDSAPTPANIAGTPANTSPITVTEPLSEPSSNRSNPSGAITPVPQKSISSGTEVWNAYSTAYFNRYGTEPVRNAKVNGILGQLIKRLGKEEAPHVAAFFVSHNKKYYIEKTHDVSVLLADAEGLRTQWATGRVITARRAAEIDDTATNASAVNEAIAMLRRRQQNASA